MRTAQFAATTLLVVTLLTVQTSALGAAQDRRRTIIGSPAAARFSSSSRSRKIWTAPVSSRSSSVSSKKVENARAGLLLQSRTKSLWKVVLVTVGSSAEKAGIKANDIFLAADGKTVAELSFGFENEALYGPKGSSVSLRFQRGSAQYTATVVRDIDSVLPAQELTVTEPKTGIFVLRIGTLGKKFRDTFRADMKKIADKHPNGIILDLRSTFAGDIPETLLLLGAFLPQGTPVIHCAKATMTDRVTGDPPIFPAETPMIALINGGTVDDAESIANALTMRSRATLVGETTNGNGYAVARLDEGTVKEKANVLCRFTDAANKQVMDEGVKPDVKVTTPCPGANDCVLEEAISLIREK